MVLTRVQSDGQILVSKRILLHGTSQMDFSLYPLDVQEIDFEIESNELSFDNLQLYWKEIQPFDVTEGFHWNGYTMFRYDLQVAAANYTHTGKFSRVVARFYLERDFGWFFVIDIYSPIIVYVVISWASFWIDIREAGARVALCVTTLLTLVTASRNARY